MAKYINDIVREYNIEHHILRNWEDKGYLGVVDRDFQHGRMYDPEQVERILFIQSVVEEQKKRGLKRTDFKNVEHKLFEKFGGMVEVKPTSIPATPEAFTNLLVRLEKQDKQIEQLQRSLVQLAQMTARIEDKELPLPIDHSKELATIKEIAAAAMTKEQGNAVIDELKATREENEHLRKELEIMKGKADLAVEYIQNEQATNNKGGFFKNLFKIK
ncbi:DNA-binding transcriptional MerR regulator [Peribacillus simplex]